MAGYHHGNLRQALLDAAVDAIREHGVAALTLRGLAVATGVSHAAPAHHFGDKAGLLTALAADGFTRLASALGDAGDDFLEVGLAYTRFALDHPAHFEVMFQPALYRADDPAVVAARRRTSDLLARTGAHAAGPVADARDVSLAGWCLMHGFATLVLAGAVTPKGDPVDLARRLGRQAFGGPARPAGRRHQP